MKRTNCKSLIKMLVNEILGYEEIKYPNPKKI